jgi:tetratricopeptide (TPR) repeat protein
MTNTPTPDEIAERAKQIYQAGDFMAAAQAFGEAASAYTAGGDAPMSAEMKNNRSVALLRAGDGQAALEAVEGTDEIFASAGDHRRQGIALANQATALSALKRFNEAIDRYKSSAEALANADEGDMRAEVMQLLSTLYLRRFKFYDAIITLQSGLAGAKNLTARQRFMKKILFIRL